ncbi:MAG: cell division protein FtsZ [Bdellovibrionales bacterium GWA2_49_15]|nr:MAG: cell division protein FtsZ [Bdellovibrionales bacterium GWA2_49_15]
MFEFNSTKETKIEGGAKIKVVGVGGGGCNAINTMIRAGLSGVEYVVANTDAQALNASLAPTKVQLGATITKGLGAGANPEVGRRAALEEYEKLSEVLTGADMVFITAGMGGGTGTGAAPVIAKLAKELGALTVGVITKPFLFEGKKRFRQAEAGIQSLAEMVDSLITIPNQRLLYLAGENLSLIDTFKRADEVLLNAVRGISDLINNTGHINADFADVCTVMSNKGLSLMGTGIASGAGRAIKAATEAISSPLLEDITIDGATGIIINITGNESLTMHETNEAVTLVMEAADEEAEIIFGTVIDPSMNDEVKVTVIATGLRGADKLILQTNNTQTPTRERAMMPEAKVEAIAAETMQAAVTETIQAAQVNEPAPSKLVQNIKEAASRYETAKNLNTTEEQRPRSATSNEKRDLHGLSRAKTIAEKLGFINFDEEELDRPSFLRKEDSAKVESQKPIEH